MSRAPAPTPARAALVFAAALVAAAAAVGLAVVVTDRVPALAAAYNRWAVWVGTALHAWEPLDALLVLAAVAALAYPTFARRPRRVRRRWHVAAWAGVLTVTAAVVGYVVYPFGFGRLSGWVWTAAPVAALTYVWVRANWAVVHPGGVGYRQNLAAYLDRAPRAAEYFRLLAVLYPSARRPWFDAPHADGDPDRVGRYRPKVAAPARAERWLPRVAARLRVGLLTWFTRLQRRRWAARLTRPMLPPLGPPLAAHDPLFRAALEHRRGVAWAAAEEALYGPRAASPLALEPDDRTHTRAAAAFRVWLEATEALAECHLFHLPAATDPARAAALQTAADLFADAARRCLTPTLRGTHANGRPVPHHWLPGAVGPTEARRFIGLEIRCLELLLGVDEKPGAGWQRAHAHWEAQATTHGPGTLVAARLLLAYTADRGAEQLANPQAPAADPPNVWPAMAAAVRHGTTAAGRAGLTPAAAAFALACRQRLLDAALSRRLPQVVILWDEVHHMSWAGWPAAAAAPWQVLEQWTAGFGRLVAAEQVAGTAREQTYRNALAHLRTTGHCALRFILESLPEERWVQHAAGHVLNEAGPLAAAPAAVVPLAEMRARAGAEPLWFRRPNYFVRPWAGAAAAVAFALVFAAAGLFRAGPVLPAPDYRLGGAALNAPVTALVAGPGDDPALWVATRGAGVHVRAPGEHHHWYHVGPTDGLLSPDVYRVGVGERFAAFVCGRDDRRGLSIAATAAAPPGSRPGLGLTDWRTILGFSGFRRVGDDRVTALLQPPGTDILFVGTRGDGIGRYHVGERRWLEAGVLDEAAGFLPPGHRAVTDLAAAKVGDDWHVWASTENGLAGGPVGDPDKAAWTIMPGAKLLSPHVAQLAVRPTPDGVSVLYRTARGGVGEVVVGAGVAPRHAVHVGETAVAGLGEDTVRRVAYGPAGLRVWLADHPAGAPARFTVYREGSREMVAVGPVAGQDDVHDLVADRAQPDRAFAATAGGVVVLTDRAGRGTATNVGPKDMAALRVVPSAENGIAVVARTTDGGTAVVRGTDPLGGEWPTAIGTRRVPGLTLDGVTAVAPRTDGPGFFLGTKAHGVVFADPATREVFAKFPTPEPGPVRDLSVVPGAKGQPDRWLLRVTDDNRLLGLSLTAPGGWKPLLNATTGGVKPAELTAAKVFGGGLYLGSTTGLARYDIDAHRWSPAPKVDGLTRLFTGAGTLWAVGTDTLYFGGGNGWTAGVPKLKAAEGDDQWVAALDAGGAVWVAEKGKLAKGKLDPIFKTTPLPAGTAAPTLATLVGGKLCVAPVPGGIGGYDPATRAWETFPLPKDARALKELRGTAAGLWAIDADGAVFLNPLAAGQPTGWRPTPVATEAEQVFFSDTEAVVRRRDKSVFLVRAAAPDPPRTLVGAECPLDLTAPVAAAAEFAGDLFVAAGERVVRYDAANHAWRTSQPADKAVVERLVRTAGYLYAVDAAGRLFRHADGPTDGWTDVTTKFTAHAAAVRPPAPAKVGAVADLGAALGVVVPGVGVFVARDAAADAPVCIQTRSPGPPADAVVTSAAEEGGALYLGTAAHGLWVYADGPGTPPRWATVALDGPALSVLPVDATRLVVRTEAGVKLVSRPPNGTWGAATDLLKTKTLAATVAADGVYAVTADPAPRLTFVSFAGKAEDVIAAPPGTGKATRAVAVDPKSGLLIRADADGRVTTATDPLAVWKAEAVTDIDTVFVAAGAAWAWSAKAKTLHRRDATWTAYAPPGGGPAAVVQVVPGDKGVLVRLDDGEVRLVGAGADVVVRPREAGAFPADWKAVTRLAELGGWLLVTTDRGTFAYERTSHRWRPLGDDPVAALAPSADDKGAAGFHLLGADGRVWHVALGNDGAPVRSGPLDLKEKVVALTPGGARALAVTDRGGVYRLGPATAELLYRPDGFDAPAVPRVGAAAEWRGKLALGFADGDAGRVAVYEPARAAWASAAVPGGAVARFHLFGPAAAPRLVAEIETTRALVELIPQAGGLTARVLVAAALDVVGADGRLWVITPDGRAVEVPAGGGELAPVGGRDALPADITAAAPFGREVVARLADKSVWHYSLDDLAWVQRPAKLAFAHLVPAGGRLYAIEDGTEKVHRYTPAEKGLPEWKVVAGAKWDGEELTGDDEKLPAAPPPLWTVKADDEKEPKSFTFEWRAPGAGKAAPQPVGFADRRFDFNRAVALGHADGLLWVETRAAGDGKPVVRRFKVDAGHAEVDAGADRFKLAADAGKAARVRRSSVAVAGAAFRVTVAGATDQAAPWPGRDAATGADVTLDVAMKVGDGFAAVHPVAAGGQVRFDLDVPTSAIARGSVVLLGAPGGVARVPVIPQVDRQPVGVLLGTPGGLVRTETWAGGLWRVGVVGSKPTDVFPGPDDAWHARVAGNPPRFLRSSDNGATWGELAGDARTAAERAWADRTARTGSNRDLANWRVVPVADGPDRLELRVTDPAGAFRPVALGPGGFDFDRLLGLDLTPDAIRAYTPAGRLDLPRGPARAVAAIDPAWAVPDTTPHSRAALDPADKADVLVATGAPPRALRRAGDKWVSLSDADAAAVVKELGKTLLDAGGWRWEADEIVRFAGPPFAADAPLRGRFDVGAGRFTFATPRAVQAHGGGVWVATDAGVLTLRGRTLAGQELADAPAPGPDGLAAIVRAADGAWLLKVAPKGAAPTVFAFADGWKPADAAARAALTESEGTLVRGAAWRAVMADGNPKADAPRVFQRAMAGGAFVRVALRPGATPVWDFEDAAAVAGPAAAPVIGTAGGLVQLRGAAWDFVPTPRGVTRLAAAGDDLHARFDDAKEALVGLTPLRLLAAAPGQLFAERDREHLAAGRWRLTRTPAGTKTEHRPAAAAPWADAGFDQRRFAFDRALAVGHAGGAALLATPAGVISRDAGAKGDFAPADGLPAPKDGTAPRFFVGWDGGEKTYFTDGAAVFGVAGGKWQPLAGAAAEAARKQADTFLARGKDWDVRRPAAGADPGFTFLDARGKEQPATFDPRRGGFTFDFPTAVLPWAGRVLVATDGGLWAYSAAGWEALDADFDGDGVADAVETLAPTVDRGPVARVRTAGGVVHLFPAAPDRPRIPAADATALADAARDRIDADPLGWDVTRRAPAFAYKWRGEPVELAAGAELRFKHDVVTAAEWHGGSVWVGSAAGVAELSLKADGTLSRPDRSHLWTTPFPAGAAAVRRVGGDTLVARVAVGEQALAFVPANRTWKTLAAGDPTDTAVVMNVEKQWVWRLRAPGRPTAAVEVELHPDRFRAAGGGAPLFSGGTFAHWDITPAVAGGDVLGWEKDWFVGTAGGVLRIDTATGQDARVYARTAGGDPLTGVTHVGTDPRGGVFARAGGKVFRFDPAKDGFEPAADADYPDRGRPVDSAWLTWTTGPAGVAARFKAGVSDAPPAGPLLAAGRFRFDDATQLAWRDGVWCHTPLGLVRADAGGGGVTHHGKGLPPPDPAARLRARGDALHLLAPAGHGHRSAGPGAAWEASDEAAAAAAREVGRNPLFVCRTVVPGGFEYALEVGDRPTLTTGPGRPPVLLGGVFGFDDLRDVAVDDDELLLATRLGVWRHDPTSPTVRVPIGGAYHTAGGADLTDLGSLVRGRPGDAPVLVSRDGKRAFARSGVDKWEERPPVAATITGQRELGPDWRLRLADGGVVVERLRAGVVSSSHAWAGPLAPGALDDAVRTPGAIWLPAERGLLWVRTRRF